MKKIKELLLNVLFLIVAIVVIVGSLLIHDYIKLPIEKLDLGGSYTIASQVLIGSPSDSKWLPPVYVMADSTTTDATNDGGLLTQFLRTEGIEVIRLNISGLGVWATNTIDIRPQFSNDGTNYYDVTYNTTTPLMLFGNGTNTPTMNAYVVSLAPGTATTSFSYDINVNGAKYTRLLIKGSEDDDGDFSEKVQASIEAVLIDKTR